MTPERWKQIEDLFDAAVTLPLEEQEAFLRRASPDQDLQQEVRRLLEKDRLEATALDRPPFRLIPSEPDDLLQAGEIVADRFRILLLLGRGGMGEVYEARDTVLDEPVALKVVRTSSATAANTDSSVNRLRELQLARRVTHPSVCRIHDVVFHTSPRGVALVILTMELIRGGTLATYLRNGSLPRHEAELIGTQLAEALDAAHARRILHGDLKPANVMIEMDEGRISRAVLTDFGLAQVLDETAEAAARRMGTPQYMAPEQVNGAAASVRSDLYSFALVLQEMLAATSDKQAQPAAWHAVFARALHPDPTVRYSKAMAIVQALFPSKPQPRLSRRVLAGATVALLLVALTIAVLRLYVWVPVPPVHEAASLLFVGTRNETGSDLFDGAGEMLRTLLSQSPHFQLVASARIAEILKELGHNPLQPLPQDVVVEVARRTGAPIAIHSALVPDDGRFSFDVTIESVQPDQWLGRRTWRQRFATSSEKETLDVMRHAARWVRLSVGESLQSVDDNNPHPSEIMTDSWQALRAFARANQKQASGDTRGAVLFLEEAVRIDPQFAPAYERLADLLLSLDEDRKAYEMWERAIRINEQRGLNSPERLRARGRYYEDTGQYVLAENTYRIYLDRHREDPNAAVWLATVLSSLDQAAEAETWLKLAVQKRPGWHVPLVHLATTLLDNGRPDEAAVQIQRLREYEHDAWATWLDGLTRFLREDIDGALRTIEPLRHSADNEWKSRAFSLRSAWMTEQGRFDDAIREMLSGIRHDATFGIRNREADKWLNLADLQQRARLAPALVRNSVERALLINDSAERLARACAILTSAGDLEAGQALSQRWASQPNMMRAASSKYLFEGSLAFARGRTRQAVRSFQNAASIGSAHRSRLLLGRALMRAGEWPEAAKVLKAEVDHVARRYRSPEPEFPGHWADALADYASVLDRLGDAHARQTWTRYQQIRSRLQHVDNATIASR